MKTKKRYLLTRWLELGFAYEVTMSMGTNKITIDLNNKKMCNRTNMMTDMWCYSHASLHAEKLITMTADDR